MFGLFFVLFILLLWCETRLDFSSVLLWGKLRTVGFRSATLSSSAVSLCPQWVPLLMSESTIPVWINLVSNCVPILPGNLRASHTQTTRHSINRVETMCSVRRNLTLLVFSAHLAGGLHCNENPDNGRLNLDRETESCLRKNNHLSLGL